MNVWAGAYLTTIVVGSAFGLYLVLRYILTHMFEHQTLVLKHLADEQTAKLLTHGCPMSGAIAEVDTLKKLTDDNHVRLAEVQAKLNSEERRKAMEIKEFEDSMPVSSHMARDREL